jgi:outer membrane receptor protein involved in Fe transport
VREVQAVSRVTEDIDLAPSSLSIIDGRELRAFGYPTIASALRGVRGVYVSNDRTYESAGIRGIGEPNDYGNRLLVLQDGLGTNDDLLNSSYIGTDARSDLHDVDRIEVIRGPGSLLYGTGAFSGVVNLVPRARDYPTQAFGGIGTYDNSVARGRAGGHVNFSDDAGVWASVSGARSEGVELPVRLIDPGGGAPLQTAHGTERFRSVSTHGRGWWGPVNAQWMYHQRKQFIPIGALNTRFDDPRTYYQDERFAGEIRVEPSWDVIDVSGRIHANHYHFGGAYVSPPPDPPLIEDYYGTWFGVEARARLKFIDELWITVGGEGQFHPVVQMAGTESTADFQPISGGEYLAEDRPFNFGAAYALVEVKPVDWFRANAGARIDVYSSFGPIVVPRGALIFRVVEGGVLKVMGGRAFRAPSVYEQYYNDGGFSQVAAVDPDRDLALAPESIYSGEIEYLQRFLEDWVAVGAVHSSYVDDIITTVIDESGPDVIRYANSDIPLFTLGGEVELRREWRRGWMLAAFYGYQRAQFLDATDPALEDNPRAINAPEHLAGARTVLPIVAELAALGVRGTLEAPRRIGYDGDAETNAAFIVDTTLSGDVARHGLHYVVGVYNVFDWSFELPVADTFASRTIQQKGRTFMLDVSIAYP